MYFIHDNNLILPEYLVEFDYEYTSVNNSICNIGETLLCVNMPELSFYKATADDKLNDIKIDHAFKSKIEEIEMKYADPKYRSSHQ